MKKALLILTLLLLVVLLAACGGDGNDTTTTTAGGNPPPPDATTTTTAVTTTAPLVWSAPNLTLFADEILTWASDENADYYEVYLNGSMTETVANEYCELPFTEGQSGTVKVVKVMGDERYHSEELTVTRQLRTTRTVGSLSALSAMASNGTVSLGGLTEVAVVLDFSRESGAKTMPTSLTVNPLLRSLTVIGSSSLTLNGFTLKVEERTEPLTIIFQDTNLKTTSSTMVYYNGSSSFTCDMLIKGATSFTNTRDGASGSNGGDASGFASAGSGTAGGSGGDIFSLPKIRLFCEALPAFTTGYGGSGGNGGTGHGLAHGGFGGSGGRGGCVFRDTAVTCFTAFFGELSGDFGLGGRGGKGGTGFSGPRSDGGTGATGALTYGGSLTYTSRTNGVIHAMPGDGAVGNFNLSAVNGYLIWNAQPSVTRYEILYRDQVYDTTTLNAYVIPATMVNDTDGLLVRAVMSSGESRISKPCIAVTLDNYTDITPTSETSIVITGAKNVRIDAALLFSGASILVMPDVQHLCLYGEGTEQVRAEVSITANNRTSNLAITLDNVILAPVVYMANAITVNGGQSLSTATDPFLIINSFNSGILGGEGRPGTDGLDSNGFSFGGDGTDGSSGADAIAAPIVVIVGTDFAAQGGRGGRGGRGGDSTGNEGGDGGDGGNGGTAIRTVHLYLLMNERTSLVTLYPGKAGNGGDAGTGFFGDASSSLTSAENGKNGSAGSTLIGSETILNGQLER